MMCDFLNTFKSGHVALHFCQLLGNRRCLGPLMYWHLAGLSKSETLALIIELLCSCLLIAHFISVFLYCSDSERKWLKQQRVLEDGAHCTLRLSFPRAVQSTDKNPPTAKWLPLSFSTQVACRKWGDSSRTMTEFMKGWENNLHKSSVNLWSLDGNKKKWPLRNLMAWFLYRGWRLAVPNSRTLLWVQHKRCGLCVSGNSLIMQSFYC